jgi:hypothetical protein
MATTTVYRVTAYADFPRYWHFATKGEAQKRIRELRRDDPEETPDLDAITVTLNARGVAEALDGFISLTCANEG